MSLTGDPFLTSQSKIFPAGKGTRGMGKTVVVSLVSGFSPYRLSCQGHVSNRYKPRDASSVTNPLNSIFWLYWCSDVLLGTAIAPESLCSRLVSRYQFLEAIFLAQDLHCSTVSTNKLKAVQGMVCNHSDSVWENRSTFVPAFPWDLVFILMGCPTSALQGQDIVTERKAKAGWVGRCHTLIRFPWCGFLSF